MEYIEAEDRRSIYVYVMSMGCNCNICLCFCYCYDRVVVVVDPLYKVDDGHYKLIIHASVAKSLVTRSKVSFALNAHSYGSKSSVWGRFQSLKQ